MDALSESLLKVSPKDLNPNLTLPINPLFSIRVSSTTTLSEYPAKPSLKPFWTWSLLSSQLTKFTFLFVGWLIVKYSNLRLVLATLSKVLTKVLLPL